MTLVRLRCNEAFKRASVIGPPGERPFSAGGGRAATAHSVPSFQQSAETCSGSTHGDRGDCRARAPLDLEWLHHEGELEDAPGRKLVELQTLQQMYAVHHEHDLVDGKRDVRIR